MAFYGLLLAPLSLRGAVTNKTGDIVSYTQSLVWGMPGDSGNDFALPKSWNLKTWSFCLQELVDATYTLGSDPAANIGYVLVKYTDTVGPADNIFYIFETNSGNHWGTYMYNPSYSRPLVIQSPHADHDFRTGVQGAWVFRESSCAFFFMNGAHRCNNSTKSGCDGTTDVCAGSQEDFQISDLAHHETNLFQLATDSLLSWYNGSYFIQLHGFTKKNSDPYLILSNGSEEEPSGTDYLQELGDELVSEDNVLTYKIAHVDTDWDRLIALTNVQGRLINGSADPCDLNATSNSARFLHVEQEKSRLRDGGSSNWTKMSNAISATFPTAMLPVELSFFKASLINQSQVKLQWQTATELNNEMFWLLRSYDGLHWRVAAQVNGKGTTYGTSDYSFYDEINSCEQRVYYRLKQIDYNGTHSYSGIVQIEPDAFQQYGATLFRIEQRNIRFTSECFGQMSYRLYNSGGALVADGILETNTVINTKTYSPGVYYLQYRSGNKVGTGKIVIQ